MTAADHEAREEAMRPLGERIEAQRAATPYPVDTGGTVETIWVEPVLKITDCGVELRTIDEVVAAEVAARQQEPKRQDIFSLMRRARPVGGGDVSATVTQLEPLMTKAEYAEHLRCSVRWVEYRVAEGLPSELIAGRRKFRATVADEWLRREGYIA